MHGRTEKKRGKLFASIDGAMIGRLGLGSVNATCVLGAIGLFVNHQSNDQLHMHELKNSKLRLAACYYCPLICASSCSLQGSTSNSGPNSNLLALADRTMPQCQGDVSLFLNLLCMGAMPVDGDWESEHSKPAQHRRLPKCPPMWWPPEWSPDLTGMGRVRRWKPPEEQGKKVLVE